MTVAPRPSAEAVPAARPALPPARPRISAGGLWFRGVLAGVGAILAALTFTLLIRAFINVEAFQSPTGEGNPGTGGIAAGAFTATLLLVLVLQVLIRFTARPFVALNAVVVLAFLAFAGVMLSSDLDPSQIFGSIITCIPIAIAVRLLVGWAGYEASGTYA